MTMYPDWLPNVEDMAALMTARAKGGEFGNTEGAFDDTTRPTDVQVGAAIIEAADIVIAKVGDVSGRASGIAKQAVKYRAAMAIELSFFPESVGTPQSAYDRYRDEYATMIKDAVDAAIEADDSEDGEPDAGGDMAGATGQFPDAVGFESLEW